MYHCIPILVLYSIKSWSDHHSACSTCYGTARFELDLCSHAINDVYLASELCLLPPSDLSQITIIIDCSWFLISVQGSQAPNKL